MTGAAKAFVIYDILHESAERRLVMHDVCRHAGDVFVEQESSRVLDGPMRKWEAETLGAMQGCDLALVLVGPHTGRCQIVALEIALAGRSNLPVVGTWVRGASAHTPLPPGLARGRVISLNWPDFRAAIAQAVAERAQMRSD